MKNKTATECWNILRGEITIYLSLCYMNILSAVLIFIFLFFIFIIIMTVRNNMLSFN